MHRQLLHNVLVVGSYSEELVALHLPSMREKGENLHVDSTESQKEQGGPRGRRGEEAESKNESVFLGRQVEETRAARARGPKVEG